MPKPINWVFTSDTEYKDIKTKLTIGTTNLAFNLKNVLGAQGDQYNWIPYRNTMYTWTGLNKEWKQADSNCENWTYNTNKYDVGRLGVTYFKENGLFDSNVVDFQNTSCNRHDNLKGAFRLVCVSQ
ncbi:MAG: DUF1554 domain-containing protein [Burkholderiales bacterium]|nr:DUF1554 domain-containing protein [Burkholderiales bacterium]